MAESQTQWLSSKGKKGRYFSALVYSQGSPKSHSVGSYQQRQHVDI